MPSEMTMKSFKRNFKLLRRWDYKCVICGRPFKNLASVTTEHIIPRSIAKNTHKADNHAPAHYRCNHLKGNRSLLAAVKLINKKEESMGDEKKFTAWLNGRVPNRHVPHYALLPVEDAEWFMFS